MKAGALAARLDALALPPARAVRPVGRLLVVDPAAGAFFERPAAALQSLLTPGDLLVLNDAATLPGSLRLQRASGEPLEARLCGHVAQGRWRAALLGAGDWRTDTLLRPPPPALRAGEALTLAGEPLRVARVLPLSPRLVELELGADLAQSLQQIYRHGRPVQYAYLGGPLALWDVQNAYAGAPAAFELPSAGRILTGAQLVALRRRGVQLATLTHAAGLSSTGDAAIDAALPLPERYVLPERTVAAVQQARERGRRVFAVGTSTVRALEGSGLVPGEGETALRIGPGFRPRVVDGLLSGVHPPGESHFELLSAFAPAGLLEASARFAASSGFLGHEFGDATLLLPGR